MLTLWILIAAMLIEWAIVVGLWFALRERKDLIRRLELDRDLFRLEVQQLTDAIARSNRTPILRKPIERQAAETWWDGQERITKVTAGPGV